MISVSSVVSQVFNISQKIYWIHIHHQIHTGEAVTSVELRDALPHNAVEAAYGLSFDENLKPFFSSKCGEGGFGRAEDFNSLFFDREGPEDLT